MVPLQHVASGRWGTVWSNSLDVVVAAPQHSRGIKTLLVHTSGGSINVLKRRLLGTDVSPGMLGSRYNYIKAA